MQLSSKNEPKFNGIYLGNNLPKIKDGTHVIISDEYKSIVTHWKTLYLNAENVTYFNSFGVEHVLKEVKKFIGNKNIITNIYRIQGHYSIMWGYFCIGFIYFMLKGKSLLDNINLFPPNDYDKNDKIILTYFKNWKDEKTILRYLG